MFRRICVAACILFGVAVMLDTLVPAPLQAQGFLIDDRADQAFRLPRHPWPWPPPHPPLPPHPPVPPPRPPQTYKIQELAVQATLVGQVAKVQLSQTFVNTGSQAMEVSFVFPLPYDGAIDRLTFLVDGKEYDAKLLDAQEARRIYEGYVRRNRDPALLEWLGAGMFKTSVFPVPAGASRTVTLRYSQVCRRIGGLTELAFPLSAAKYTSQPVEKLDVRVTIESAAPIKNVYSPSHAIETRRPDDKHAVATFSSKNTTPTADFRLLYDVGAEPVGASVLSYRRDADDEGYFLLLVAPEIKKTSDQIPKKNVIFVVDRSGSMSGKKIEQAKASLKFVLNNLREGDLFNVIAYDTEIESFRPELQRYDDASRKAAIGFVEGIYAGGSTNIDGALKSALAQLTDDSRPSYVIFLTDGLPTAGETKEAQIVANARERNKQRVRIFTLGVGYDVNSRLLDKLARAAYGQTEYVRPDEDIETYVGRLYGRIGAPALIDASVRFDVEGAAAEQGPAVNRVYPSDLIDLFAGDQLVLAGRYKKPGAAKVVIRGKVEGKELSFDFPAQLVERSNDETSAFVEKIWAQRRIGAIIDQIDLQGQNKELVDELVALSKKHGILTPYTAFLADDQAAPQSVAAQRRTTEMALDALGEASGAGGFSQRAAKNELLRSAQAPAAASGGGAVYRDVRTDRPVTVRSVQNVGAKTFFLRDGRWVDAAATPEQERDVRRIERFSPEYFDLIARHGRDAAQYLAIEGQVLVVLDGQAYQF